MKVYKKSLAQFVLIVLEKSIDGYVRVEDFAQHHYRYFYGAPELKKSSLAAAIARLRQGGLVQIKSKRSDILVKLTKLGKESLNDFNLDDQPWDGKWRLVIFDIPETQRAVRDLFRRRLKDWGFRNFQQSVWVTKKNVTGKMRKLINKLEIDDWVAVIESEDKALSNIYNL